MQVVCYDTGLDKLPYILCVGMRVECLLASVVVENALTKKKLYYAMNRTKHNMTLHVHCVVSVQHFNSVRLMSVQKQSIILYTYMSTCDGMYLHIFI